MMKVTAGANNLVMPGGAAGPTHRPPARRPRPIGADKDNTMMTINPLPSLPSMPRKSKTPQACTCGCGLRTKGGRYVPGHDARHHGWAIRIAGGYDTKGITEGEARAATAAIRAGQWPDLKLPSNPSKATA